MKKQKLKFISKSAGIRTICVTSKEDIFLELRIVSGKFYTPNFAFARFDGWESVLYIYSSSLIALQHESKNKGEECF